MSEPAVTEEEKNEAVRPRLSSTQTSTQTVGATAAEQQLQRQLQQYQQQSERQMQLMQEQLAVLTTLVSQRVGTTEASKAAISTAADTLPTPTSAVKQAPRAAARRVTYPQAAASIPSTPRTPTSALGDDEEATEAATAMAAAQKAEKKMTLKDILQTVKGFVDPFYADSEKDKGTTVVDFVEKVESAMIDVIDDQPRYKLAVVRMFLREGALRWLNRRIKELEEAGYESIDWDKDVRKAFIEAHIGTDTVELWLAKLATLRLGKGSTRTPIELDNQFDTIARHVHPTQSAGDKGVDLLLSTQYRDIIAASNREMFKSIVRTQPHSNLKEWKTAVAMQWNAEAQIRAMTEQQETTAPGQWRGNSSGRGRGGRGGGTGSTPAQPATTAALKLNADDGPGQEGEEHTVDGESDEQLSAAGSSRGRRGGGRGGGRGGRGGGGAGQSPRLSEERVKKLAEEGKCFRCGQVGHIARGCSNARVDLSKE
jgi:hypothetical protein